MIDLLVTVARLAQFAGAATLFGAPMLFLSALGATAGSSDAALKWGRPMIRWSALSLLLGAVCALFGQTALMAGDPASAFDPETLLAVLTGTAFGLAIGARFLLSALALALGFVLQARTPLWLASVAIGAPILASFAWTGHGATEEGLGGLVHAVSDVIHMIAAAVWVGALVAFAIWLRSSSNTTSSADLANLHRALERFSGVGSLAVAALIATGLVNSWFLVGPSNVPGLFNSAYGWVLFAKLAFFAAMLLLAAINRFWLTPNLGRMLAVDYDPAGAIRELRGSVMIETSLAFAVLVLVSVLGMLTPTSAG